MFFGKFLLSYTQTLENLTYTVNALRKYIKLSTLSNAIWQYVNVNEKHKKDNWVIFTSKPEMKIQNSEFIYVSIITRCLNLFVMLAPETV